MARTSVPDPTERLIASGTPQGRWVLTAAVLGSGMAMLDGTVVNIALRNVGRDLGATVPELQWVVNAYLLALASLILVGGSLGDHLGRRRMFMVGVAWFALASALCGVAQSPVQLIAARLFQGVGAALLTPGSLAMIQGSFRPRRPGPGDRAVGRPRRHRRGDRAAAGRLDRRQRELAVDLPDQRAGRGRGAAGGGAARPGVTGPAGRPQLRLARRDASARWGWRGRRTP